MDRFAFLASQPWLYPPPDDVASALCGGDDARVLVVSDDGVHRFIPAHLLLDADFDGVLRTPPARGRVAHHHHHADLSVVFDGCASFHFSEREQYGHPPAPPRADRDVGTPGVVGAAASDALHMAFAPTDECPDQAQFACRIRARRCERVQPETDATWLEITIDGFARAVDLSQARHVVVGPPIDARPDPKHREPDLVSPDRRARRPSHRHRHRHRRRRRRRGRGRDARREFDSDSDDSYRYDCDDDDDDDESPFGASGNRAEDVGFDADAGFDRRLTALTANAPRNTNTQTADSDDIDDDARAEAGETPYASVVFSHVTLNLYHDAGLLGCRRASPAGEREKIAAVRDALERFRAAAADAATNAATSRALAPSSAEFPSPTSTPTPQPHGVSSAQPQPGDSHSPLGAPTTPNTDTAVHRRRLRGRGGEVRAASAAAIATRRELDRALVAATRLTTERAEDENEGDENDDAGGAGPVPGAREGRLARALTRAARRSAEALEETRRESERRSRRARRVAAALDEAERDVDAEDAAEDAAWRDELARMRGWTDEATLVDGRERSTSADELGEARFA